MFVDEYGTKKEEGESSSSAPRLNNNTLQGKDTSKQGVFDTSGKNNGGSEKPVENKGINGNTPKEKIGNAGNKKMQKGAEESLKKGIQKSGSEVAKKGVENAAKVAGGVAKAGGTVAGGVATGGVSLAVQAAGEGVKKLFDQANNMFNARSADKDYGMGVMKWGIILFFPLILVVVFSTVLGFGIASGTQNYSLTQFSGTRYDYRFIKAYQFRFAQKFNEAFPFDKEILDMEMNEYKIMQPYTESVTRNKRVIEFSIIKAKMQAKKDTETIIKQCGYDYDLTIKSYDENEDPYLSIVPPQAELTNNVNYAEFLVVMSQAEEFSLTESTFEDMLDFFKIEENLRFLYNLSVEAEYLLDEYGEKIKKENYYSAEVLAEMNATLQTELLPDEIDPSYVIVGKVSFEKYCLKQLYDMLSITAEELNKDFYSIINYEFLDYQELLLRTYRNDVDLGPKQRTDYTTDAYYNNTTIGNMDLITSDLTSMPQFFQGNYPKDPFGSSTIAKSGCGPTSMAMITSFFTGQMITPVTIASEFSNYYISGAGMSHSMPSAVANKYGYRCIANGVSANTQTMVSQLAKGNPVMVRFKPGKFTGGGHLAAICGVTSDGRFIMRDPNSANYRKYGSTYSLEDIQKEATKMWIFSK